MPRSSPRVARSPPPKRKPKGWRISPKLLIDRRLQIGEIAAAIALAAATAACARHYTTTGLVLKVDQPSSTVTISHDAFPGFMDAMVMPFGLKRGAQSVPLTPGDRVRFRLSVKGGRSWVDRVEVVSAPAVDAGLQQTPAAPV